MKFVPGRCPECGAPADAVEESVLLDAALDHDEGTGEYTWGGGEDEVAWDTSEPVERDGKAYLRCGNGHRWYAVPDWRAGGPGALAAKTKGEAPS